MVLANDRHDHADGELGDGFGGVGGDADDGEGEGGGGGEVDIVEAGAAEGDVFLRLSVVGSWDCTRIRVPHTALMDRSAMGAVMLREYVLLRAL